MDENWRFYVWLGVFCAAFALMVIMAVFQTISAHSIGVVQ